MGQRGQLDRIPVAHAGFIISLDWAPPPTSIPKSEAVPQSSGNAWIRTGLLDDLSGIAAGPGGGEGWSGSLDADDGRMGWLASGGLDRTVKVSAQIRDL